MHTRERTIREALYTKGTEIRVEVAQNIHVHHRQQTELE